MRSNIITDMRNRVSQRKKYYGCNGRQIVLVERAKQGDCTFCPANHNENENGSHSQWGREVAAKRAYSTGKGRKEINWDSIGPWNLTDKHYAGGYRRDRIKRTLGQLG